MNRYFACPVAQAFYQSDLHLSIPETAIELTAEQFHACFDAIKEGAGAVLDWSSGLPVAVPRPGPSLIELRQIQVELLGVGCASAITAGFESAALGAVHLYPAKLTDQINVQASVIDSIVPGLPNGWVTPFWCADDTGLWAYRLHSAQQIQQVGRDGKAAITALLERKGLLELRVSAAETPEEVAGVVWSLTDQP